MSAVYERVTGARILPSSADERATTSTWLVHCVTDADLRVRHESYQAIAADLEVRRE